MMKLFYTENPSNDEESVLIDGLSREALKAKNLSKIETFGFFLKDREAVVYGGIKGAMFYGCLYIDSLYVTPSLRGKGWGKQLVEASEQLGLEKGCLFISVTTMDWEALPFYQKLGYEIEYVRGGYEKDSKMFLLRKVLV